MNHTWNNNNWHNRCVSLILEKPLWFCTSTHHLERERSNRDSKIPFNYANLLKKSHSLSHIVVVRKRNNEKNNPIKNVTMIILIGFLFLLNVNCSEIIFIMSPSKLYNSINESHLLIRWLCRSQIKDRGGNVGRCKEEKKNEI